MKLFFILQLFLFSFNGISQNCNLNALIIEKTRASQTDDNIAFELNRHFSYYNPTCASKNILLVHLVGSFDNPSSTTLFPTIAANQGFHVIVLKYPNNTAAQNACGNSSDQDCYLNFRKEIIEKSHLS